MSTALRSLSDDAAAFVARLGSESPFSGDVTDLAAAAFLESERSRLGVKVGATALRDDARSVLTDDHRLGNAALRTYRPAGGDAVKPVLVYVHGGGWVSGSIEQHDSTCRILAAAGDIVVVNVDYRLAPENPYPAALDDVLEALGWTRANAASLGADPRRLAVCGSSSGGNLAAAAAIRDAGSTIALQVLIYPALDASMAGASHAENGSGYFVTSGQMSWYWQCYRGDQAGLDDDAAFNPAGLEDVRALPPAIVLTAEFDLLRDDGIQFAQRLHDAGVAVRHLHFPGQIHGFLGLLDDIAEAYPAVQGLGATIGEALRSGASAEVWRVAGPPASSSASSQEGTP